MEEKNVTPPQPKAMPTDLSFDSLFAPNTAYPYLAQAAAHPFREQSPRFQMVNAWWLAEVAMLVYVRDRVFVRDRLTAAGLDHTIFFEKDATQGFITSNESCAIVCFRGTEIHEPQDIITHLKFWQVQSSGGGRVHAGFEAALDKVWDDMTAHLQAIRQQSGNRLKVWFTGHSLGAALATLAADRHGDAQGVYTFGSPRVGNADFRKSYTTRTFRFVHNNDIVPMVPPPVSYQHVGQLRYIDSSGHVHDNPDVWYQLKNRLAGQFFHLSDVLESWSDGAFDAIPTDYLSDHAPIYYVTHIWNDYIREAGTSA